MLIFMARLQRFDTTQEEAALDLGANPRQVFWRITVPYMRPAFLSAGALAFLQSFENYTTTYFAIGAEQTFTIFIANKVRQGVTPGGERGGVRDRGAHRRRGRGRRGLSPPRGQAQTGCRVGGGEARPPARDRSTPGPARLTPSVSRCRAVQRMCFPGLTRAKLSPALRWRLGS